MKKFLDNDRSLFKMNKNIGRQQTKKQKSNSFYKTRFKQLQKKQKKQKQQTEKIKRQFNIWKKSRQYNLNFENS